MIFRTINLRLDKNSTKFDRFDKARYVGSTAPVPPCEQLIEGRGEMRQTRARIWEVADSQHEQPADAGPQFDGLSGILEFAGGEVTVSGRYWDTSYTGQYLPGPG